MSLLKTLLIFTVGYFVTSCSPASNEAIEQDDLLSKNSWLFTDPQFSYQVNYKMVPYPGDPDFYGRVVNKISIYSKKENELIQTIIPAAFRAEPYIDSFNVFIVEDMNFDGFNDLRLVNWISTQSDMEYWYWFFNPQSGQFEADSSLNDLMNPAFDPKRQTVYTRWRVGINENGHAIYGWQGEQLQLLISQTQSMGPDTSKGAYLDCCWLDGDQKKCDGKKIKTYIHLTKKELLHVWNTKKTLQN